MQIKLSKKDFKKDKIFKMILEGLKYPHDQIRYINDIILDISGSKPILPY